VRELIRDLALTLRERVLPHLDSHAARAYDIAAAMLILEEAGAVVSDAYGHSLGARPLLGSTQEFHMSVVAGANERLHRAILEAVDAGFARVSG
jgi:fructose-1,6-bisphosphatase/inositol monophosphatase family enzyme